jgi:hypothetical protein
VVPCWCIPKALPHIFIQRPGALCSMACGPTVHIAYWQLPSATPIESVCPSLAEFEGLLNRFGQRVDERWLISTRSVMPGPRRHGLFTWSVFSAAGVEAELRWVGHLVAKGAARPSLAKEPGVHTHFARTFCEPFANLLGPKGSQKVPKRFAKGSHHVRTGCEPSANLSRTFCEPFANLLCMSGVSKGRQKVRKRFARSSQNVARCGGDVQPVRTRSAQGLSVSGPGQAGLRNSLSTTCCRHDQGLGRWTQGGTSRGT